ncbi:hypothetical protein GUJ93_ZPchr0002g24871 [Zizania palustris]|uniref:EF-hand domain-containing protein n=1 Tax=Zizania palustris TaxID=103762 RepID=A0A8J5RGS8_ZIZPA|nr:hypothetical protein GUJ93_ZPchr0002g24871 [Zizania palustris]
MEHVLLVLRETEAEWEARIRGMFRFFDASGRGHLDHEQIEADLSALHLPPEGGGWKGDYARAAPLTTIASLRNSTKHLC